MDKIFLASGSPRRRELLAQTGIPYEVLAANVDETADTASPASAVVELALRKAWAAQEQVTGDGVILGADTMVVLEGDVLGKPADEEDAVRMLRALSGRCHQVYTGVAMIRRLGMHRFEKAFFQKTEVEMYELSEEEIAAYVATGEPMDKAGAYGIQGKAALFIRGIHGDYNNVVGLPLARVCRELKDWRIFPRFA